MRRQLLKIFPPPMIIGYKLIIIGITAIVTTKDLIMGFTIFSSSFLVADCCLVFKKLFLF